jgi:hypothetical protein
MFNGTGELVRHWCDSTLPQNPQKGNTSKTQLTETSQGGRSTPTRPIWKGIKTYCKVSFSHKMIDPPVGYSPVTTVNGRVDHAIGFVPKSRDRNSLKRRFHSLILVVEAKHQSNVVNALPQLVVYLACLRQARLNRQRRDTSVYGVASDGVLFEFVTITHDGVLKMSKRFNAGTRDLAVVLGCLAYVLGRTIETLTSEKMVGQQSDQTADALALAEADTDDAIQVDDNDFLQQPTGEDEGEDSDEGEP